MNGQDYWIIGEATESREAYGVRRIPAHPYPQNGWLNILVDIFHFSNRTGVRRALGLALLLQISSWPWTKPRRGGLFIARTAQKRSFLFVFQRREGRAAEKQKEML